MSELDKVLDTVMRLKEDIIEKSASSEGKFYNYCYGYVQRELGNYIRILEGESSAYYARLHQIIMKACRKIEAVGGVVSISSVMKETGLSKKNVTRELQIDYTKVSYEALDRVS